MFSTRTSQASSATSCTPRNFAPAPNVKTSTTVVKSLARGLLAASPGQALMGRYINFKFGMGQKPSYGQSLWLGLRKITQHMDVIEQLAIKANRPLSERDCRLAARRSMEYLSQLLKCLTEKEKSHPSFRQELIEHMGNIIRWYPNTTRVWVMAYKNLQPGEHITYKNRPLDSNRCRFVANYIHEEAQRLEFDRLLNEPLEGQP